MTNLFQDAVAYTKTEDYYHGVIVGLTGTIIEVILLSMTVPFVIWFVQKIRTRRVRSTIDFYLFQIFHKITDMFLNMASVNDIGAFAGVNLESHFFYGNLENKFSALNKVFEDKDYFKKSVEKKTVDDFQRYLATCERCLDEIDRLIAMTGLITILNDSSNVQEVAFTIRLRASVLRDLTGDVLEDFRRSKSNGMERNFHTSDLEEFAKLLTAEVNAVFQGRKKLVDSIVKHDRIRWVVGLFVTLPYIVIRCWISIKICRLRKIPYQDPDYPSYAAFLLKE